MKKNNTVKWSYGAVVALVLGLTGCYFDGQSAQEVNYSNHSYDNSMPKAQVKGQGSNNAPTAAKKSYSSNSSTEPAQKSTPGPKRTAAPQLPVIQ